MSRSLGQASHPTMPVFMTPNVRNRDHGVVKQTNKNKKKTNIIIMYVRSQVLLPKVCVATMTTTTTAKNNNNNSTLQ